MNPAPRLALQTSLARHLVCAQGLLQVLDDEHAALLDNDAEGLQTLAPAKLRAVRELQLLGESLARLAAGRPLVPCLEEAGLADDWTALVGLTEQLRKANQENGSLLDARLRQIRRELIRLGTQGSTAYGRSGQLDGLPTARRLAVA